MIDGAKDQFAIENRLPEGTVVDPKQVIPYLKGNAMPKCPSGGIYSIGKVGEDPSCSIPGHSFAAAAKRAREQSKREGFTVVAITGASIAVVWLVTCAIVVGLQDRKSKRSPQSPSVDELK